MEPIDDEQAYGKKFISDLMGRAMLDRYEVGKMLKYLVHGSGMPAIKHGPLPGGIYGQFSHDTAIPRDPGQVDISANSVNTLVHELTHAVQKQMVDQVNSPTVGKQFREGYGKLMGQGRGPSEVSSKMAPQWQEAAKGYRGTTNELQAHAMGNQSPLPHPSLAAPANIDPTLATEFMILLDLASRDQAQQRKQP